MEYIARILYTTKWRTSSHHRVEEVIMEYYNKDII